MAVCIIKRRHQLFEVYFRSDQVRQSQHPLASRNQKAIMLKPPIAITYPQGPEVDIETMVAVIADSEFGNDRAAVTKLRVPLSTGPQWNYSSAGL
jgi:hypothetical protein